MTQVLVDLGLLLPPPLFFSLLDLIQFACLACACCPDRRFFGVYLFFIAFLAAQRASELIADLYSDCCLLLHVELISLDQSHRAHQLLICVAVAGIMLSSTEGLHCFQTMHWHLCCAPILSALEPAEYFANANYFSL